MAGIAQALFMGYGQGGAAWTPASLFASSEVGAWYDPSDLTTMWTDDGTTQAGVNDLVYRIDDKSGNGRHLSNSTSSQRPILRQDGSGNYYLEFDGAGDVLGYLTNINISERTTYTVAYAPTSDSGYLFYHKGSAGNYVMVGQSGSTSTTLTSNATLNALYVDNSLFSGTQRGEVYTALEAGSVAHIDFTPTGANFTNHLVGYYASFTQPKKIYQIVVRKGEMTSGDRTSLANFCAAKAGVTL